MKKDNEAEKKVAQEKSYLALYHIFFWGGRVSYKNLLPHHWLEIIEKMIESIRSILKETICDKTIDGLLFNRSWKYDNLELQIETAGWNDASEKNSILKKEDHYLMYLGTKFGIIGDTFVRNLKGCIASRAFLAVNENCEMFLFIIRLTTKEIKIKSWTKAEVKECRIFSISKNREEFTKVFFSLAKNNPRFFRKIVGRYLDKAYLHISKKEDEYKALQKFKEMRERISFSD